VPDFKVGLLVWLLAVIALAACSTVPLEPGVAYSAKARAHLYQLEKWSFEGRLSLTGNKDSWSASVVWVHIPAKEQLKLSGPLGQGGVIIQLTNESVSIDRGNGDVQTSGQPEAFVNQQLGLFVPLSSLRYWVVGLPEPTEKYEETDSGFKQAGWLVDYRQMEPVGDQGMPSKITVMNERVKLKLVIDDWVLDSVATR